MKLLRFAFLAVLMFVVVTFPAIAGSNANPGDIVINEFMANPASPVDDANGEWIEIVNTTSSTIDINGWTLENADGSEIHTINNGGSLNVGPGGDYVVLCINSNVGVNGNVLCDYDYANTWNLNNTGTDAIILREDAAFGGQIIARRDYDAGSAAAGQSSFYVPSAKPPAAGYLSDNNNNGQWANTSLSGAAYSSNNHGTPGAKNTQTGDSTPTAITLRALTVSSGDDPSLLSTGLVSVLVLMIAGIGLLAYRRRPI